MAGIGGPNTITDGLVLSLDAANVKSYPGSGTVWKDLSGNGNDGTLVNGPTFDSGNGGSIVYDNTNDYTTLPNDIGYVTQFSAFVWVKIAGNPAGGYHIIFGGQELEISIPTAGELRVGLLTNTRYVSNHGGGLADGEWHNVGFTFNGSTKEAYIDGTSVGSQAVSGTLTYNFSNRTIGRFGSNLNYYLNGNLTNITIYSRALSLKEIQQNYNSTKQRFK